SLSSAREFRAVFVLTDANVAEDFLDGIGVNQWSHIGLWISAITDTECLRLFHELVYKLTVHLFVNYEARRSCATLARSTKGAPNGAFNCQIDVSVVHDDDGVLATHLERTDSVSLGTRRRHDS